VLTEKGDAARPGLVARRPGLSAHPYKAARGTAAGGLPVVAVISAGVMVASASAITARVCTATCGHFTAA
jgi:hypothetical protein